ncbi:MAG: glycosyltransferase family 2 protein [Candidatus Planktophila sp.]|jgi:glycosyltransferase involved in cell wall biosynthesis|tara:strand:+ start:1148 stop:2215 length:1068 start_codon:yes stop_codon:yes gene_type:complete
MSIAIFLLTLILLTFATANFLTIRRAKNSTLITDSISILIPVRNEAENVADLVESLINQKNLSALEIIFIDDSSEDQTRSMLTQAKSAGANIEIIIAPSLAQGWLGKPWALQHGLARARGEIIVTLDADVRISPTALSQSVAMLGKRDFISPYPRQIAVSFAERLVQPLLQWSWMTTVPLRLAERSSLTSLAVANGQLFLVKKSALAKIDGFTPIAGQVLDDIELARALIKSGFHGGVADGSNLAETRMYKNFAEIKAGYGKSLWKAFANPLGALFAALFIFATGILPVILWLMGDTFGLLAYIAMVISRMISAKSSRGRVVDSFLHPISSLVIIYLIFYSWRMRGQVKWKGRTV